MDQENSKGAEIITRLMALVERYLIEMVAQRVTLNTLSEFWPGEEELDWRILFDGNKTRIAQAVHEKIELIRDMLLEELSRGHLQHFEDWEKIAQRLVESVEGIDRPE
jgi:flagellar basal body-associated protein FliL